MNRSKWRRAVLWTAVLVGAGVAQGQVGKRFPAERKVVNDARTGTPMTVLTDGRVSDAKIYQTHPSWTMDGKWVIFRTAQRAEGSQAFAVNEQTGDIIQLTQGAGTVTGSLNIALKSMKLYYFRNAGQQARGFVAAPTTNTTTNTSNPVTAVAQSPGKVATERQADDQLEIVELDLEKLFVDVYADQVKSAAAYERVCGALPAGMRDAGGFGLDANETHAYISVSGGDCGQHLPQGVKVLPKPEGARMGAGPGGLRSMDLRTGEIKVILDTPFQIGHVQTNPWVPGEILYCWETGGKAPQRMWTTRADGTGNRPLFGETEIDWITHEVFSGPDEVMFNMIGHQKRLRVRPTGVAVIHLRTGAVNLLGQIEEFGDDPNDLGVNAAGPESYGGFWHCNGSADRKWAVADTFKGDIYMIRRSDGQRILWSTDHKMKPDHAHATFSPDSRRFLIQSGHFTDGQRLQLISIPVPRE